MESHQIKKLVCKLKLSTAAQTSIKKIQVLNICFEAGFQNVFYNNQRDFFRAHWLIFIINKRTDT